MTEHDVTREQSQTIQPHRRSALSVRRFALLATTIAGVSAVALTGLPINNNGGLTVPAYAQNVSADAKAAPNPSGFADIVATVKPAVISVRVKKNSSPRLSSNERGPFDNFFRRGLPDGVSPYMPDGIMPGTPQRRPPVTGQGSGFFITADGYAVTNYHVVDGADEVEVATDDNKKYVAKVVGTDQRTDLALIKVEGENFPFVKFADELPRIGDWVLAVGNPFGLSSTVTAGIVSAHGRHIGAGPYDDFVQIDAPVNRGNSGGPTFDIHGRVIGVNSAILSPSGGNVGIAFAIPAETVKMVVTQLREHGKVTRGWLGVQIQSLTPELASTLGLQDVRGALVAAPQPGSPAANAGMKAGDVILSINGETVKDARELARQVAALAPGSEIKFGLRRDGTDLTLSVRIGEMAPQREARASSFNSEQSRLGLTVAPAERVNGAGTAGVVVTSVDPNGIAAGQFKAGDVILEVGGHAVSTPAEVRSAITDARSNDKRHVLMRIRSGDTTKFIAVPLDRA